MHRIGKMRLRCFSDVWLSTQTVELCRMSTDSKGVQKSAQYLQPIDDLLRDEPLQVIAENVHETYSGYKDWKPDSV